MPNEELLDSHYQTPSKHFIKILYENVIFCPKKVWSGLSIPLFSQTEYISLVFAKQVDSTLRAL